MPPLEQMDLTEKAILWELMRRDEDGDPVVAGEGVEIDVRWVVGQRLVMDAQGNQRAVDATVVVDQDVPLGSVLWRGSRSDLEATTLTGTDTLPDDSLMEAVVKNEAWDLKGCDVRRTLGLVYFRDTFPSRGT